MAKDIALATGIFSIGKKIYLLKSTSTLSLPVSDFMSTAVKKV